MEQTVIEDREPVGISCKITDMIEQLQSLADGGFTELEIEVFENGWGDPDYDLYAVRFRTVSRPA
jgi:hypothetical protein